MTKMSDDDLAAAQAESDAIDAIEGDDLPMHFRADGSLHTGLTGVPQDRSDDGVPEVEQRPAPARTLADDVATLRAILVDAGRRIYFTSEMQDLLAILDRIAGEVPVPTRVWMHRCGVVLINDTEPPPCHVCVSTPQIPFVRLYSLGEVR